MKIAVRSIHNQGAAAEEFVTIDVIEDVDLDFYAIADTTYVSSNKISDKLRHFYWFPKVEVAAGDVIFLITGHGKNQTQVENGITMHFFYWGLSSAVWNNTGDAAVIFEIDGWKTTMAL